MTQAPPSAWWRKKQTLAAAALVLVLVLVGGAFALTGGGGDQDRASTEPSAATANPATEQPTSSAPPVSPETSPVPSEEPAPTADPEPRDGTPPTLPGTRPATDLDETASFGGQVQADIRSIERIEGEGRGPGEVSGPAVMVDLRLQNSGGEEVTVQNAVVNLTYGRRADPASPLESDRRARPFTGTVGAGDTATGRYIFTVPDRSDLPVSVTFSYSGQSATVLFTGRL